jgi:hypothetical protein
MNKLNFDSKGLPHTYFRFIYSYLFIYVCEVITTDHVIIVSRRVKNESNFLTFISLKYAHCILHVKLKNRIAMYRKS